MYSNSDFKILDFGGFYLFISPTGVLSPYIPTQKPVIVSEYEYHDGIVDEIKNLIESGSYVVIRGSFDHFHRGHILLIDSCTNIFPNSKIIFNVSTDDYNIRRGQRKEFLNRMQPYRVRVDTLKEYLSRIGMTERIEIIPLEDAYGELVFNPDVGFNAFGNDGKYLKDIRSNMEIANNLRNSKGFPSAYPALIPLLMTGEGKL